MGARVDRQPSLIAPGDAGSAERVPQTNEGASEDAPSCIQRIPIQAYAAGLGGLTAPCGRPMSRASTTIITSVTRYAAIWIPAGRAV